MKICDETKIKIFILFLLENLTEKIDRDTLTEIILYDQTVNYFIYCDCLKELEKGGLIEISPKENGGEICTVSPLGKQVLGSLEGELLEDVKRKLLVSASRLLAMKKNPASPAAGIVPGDGGFFLDMSLSAQGKRMMSLSLYLDSFEEAEEMKAAFFDSPEEVYAMILARLTGKYR